ncbi:Zinc finger and SCAN domain-containing protein 29 [Merluccius polli]|uniref:Zinc finger and SCAN domain-containing protein 29 n=1 Tax=Merluccius polli TaxID=89951 RepID=A0AA47MN45_MERPO|nr:Zinc finger and SCAN domain-containing protein 29 [Merluccius polli]
MTSQKTTPWSVEEVQTFLSLVAEERIQQELDGTTRNEKVFKEIAQLMANHGYNRTLQQCRDKLKKMKSDYRAVKDHNGRSGANRRAWRWFDQMVAIYGHRPANKGRESGLDSATTLLQSMIEDGKTHKRGECATQRRLLTDSSIASPTSAPATASTPAPASAMSNTRVVTGKRKRSLFQQDQNALMRDIHADEVAQQEQNRAQRESHIQLLLTDAREARAQEATLRREENAQTAAFNQTFLGLLGQLVQAMSDRRT